MSVGRFKIEVSNPYPAWCRILFDDQEIRGIHHKDLRDLEYAVKRARREAREKLDNKDQQEA